jgi:arylsulfatase
MDTRPNILLLMADQHRADYVGFASQSKLRTPYLERIARGTVFDDAITVNPVCQPARASLVTGKYGHQIGALAMSGDLSPQHPTFLRALQSAGYHTAGVGKMHLLQGWPWNTPRGGGHDLVRLEPHMKRFGFDDLWEVSGKQLVVRNYCRYAEELHRHGRLDTVRDHIEREGNRSQIGVGVSYTGQPWPFEEQLTADHLIGREIRTRLEKMPTDRPFFLMGSFCGPHVPFDPPARFLDQVEYEESEPLIPGPRPVSPEQRRQVARLRQAYRAMILAIDEQIGLILDLLERRGLADNTVVAFTSDHGECLGDRCFIGKNMPYRSSVAIPMAIHDPRRPVRQRVASPVELIDLTATLLDIAGIDPRTALSKPWPAFHDRVPARSLLPIVRGQSTAVREIAFSEFDGRWQMLQTSDWKYIHRQHSPDSAAAGEELYERQVDPDETRNLAADPRQRDRLHWFRERRAEWIDQTPPAQLRWAPAGDDPFPD